MIIVMLTVRVGTFVSNLSIVDNFDRGRSSVDRVMGESGLITSIAPHPVNILAASGRGNTPTKDRVGSPDSASRSVLFC